MTTSIAVRDATSALFAGDTELPLDAVNTVLAVARAPSDAAAARLFEDRYEILPAAFQAKLRLGLIHALRTAVTMNAEPAR